MVLEETDRILPCGFCRTRLYLSCGDFFRYYLPPNVDSVEEILFIPYWRTKGIVFLFQDNEIRQKILDSNTLALKDWSLPPTLGLRPQILRLRFPGPRTEGRFLKPDIPYGRMRPDSPKPVPARPEGPSPRRISGHYEALVGETKSIIYSPVFRRGGSYLDAILNRPVAPVSESLDALLASPDRNGRNARNVGAIEFIPTLCPRCGWDMEGDSETLVLLCKNCQTAWEASGKVFREVDYSIMESTDGCSIHLPFWRITARIHGIQLQTYEDLVEFANLPVKPRKGRRTEELDFWIPAFKVNPLLFLRLAKVVTIHQPVPETDKTLPGTPLYPVTLPIGEGAEGVKLAAANLAVPRGPMLSRLSELQVDIVRYLLTYVPFTERGSEIIHSAMTISIQRSALKLGRLF